MEMRLIILVMIITLLEKIIMYAKSWIQFQICSIHNISNNNKKYKNNFNICKTITYNFNICQSVSEREKPLHN